MIKRYWKHSLGIIGGGALLLFLYLVFCAVSPSDIVLTVTAIIIYWYTLETYAMRKEIANQTKILTSPFISVSMEMVNPDFPRLYELFVKNDGEVTARNIELNPLGPIEFNIDAHGNKKSVKVSSYRQ